MVAVIGIAAGLTAIAAALFGWFWWRTRDYPDPYGGPVTSRVHRRPYDER